MNLTAVEINQFIANYFWPFTRISGLIMVMPIFGNFHVPRKIQLLLAMMLTLVIAPTINENIAVEIFSLQGAIIIAQQLLIGIVMGFVFQLVFQSFVIGGQIIAMQSGLGFAALVQPHGGGAVPLMSQFYLLLVTMAFLALNGHLIMIEVLAKSFQTLPATTSIGTNELWALLDFTKWIFKGAVLIALPAIISLLVVNLTFGVMTRAAPQMNIFAVGFPITLMIGIFILYITLSGILPHITSMSERGLFLIKDIIHWS